MKRFVTILVGLALAMTARPAATKEFPPAEAIPSSPPSPHAAGIAIGKEVTFGGVELLDGTGTASCDDDGVLDKGETARVRVTLRNSGTERLKWTSMTLSSTDPDISFPQARTVYFGAIEPGQSGSAELPVALSDSAATPRDISLSIAYRDDEQAVPGDKTHTVTYRVNIDERPGTSTLEKVDSVRHPWTFTVPPAGSTSWTRESDATGAWFFRGPDNKVITDLSLVSPPLQVSATETFRVIFQHRYAFEASPAGFYDGAIIELSQDDGKSWVGIDGFVSPAYNATIDAGGDNPLKGKKAYGGQSPGYPAFTKATISLGTTYAGETVRIRFRIGTDSSTGATGWDLDDLQVEGVVNTPFTTLEPDQGKCTNRVPVAEAGPEQTVDEGRFVTLSGSGTDPEGDPLTYEWTQTQPQSPRVTLSDPHAANPTFLAPEVTGHTDFEFELRVSDGVTMSPPDGVTVRVRDLSPVAEVKPVEAVDEGTKVTLEGSASSPDEAAVFVYTWTQLGEPSVTLSDSDSATPSFTAPQVDSNTELTFQLVVSDGESKSGPATVTVLVRDMPNAPPVAQAGEDQAVREVSGVTLDGSKSKDPEGSDLLYTWTQVDGPTVKLMPEGPKAKFNAPDVDEETAFTFELQVKDASGLSGKDTVTVRVSDNVTPPGNGSGCGCAAGQEGGVSTTAMLLLAVLGFVLRRPRWRSL